MSNRIEYAKASPAGYKAFGGVHVYLQNCGLPKELIDLVYLRVSQINGCAYCIDMHSRDLLKLGVTVDKLVLVPVWREAGDILNTRERVAPAWAETLTRVTETGIPCDWLDERLQSTGNYVPCASRCSQSLKYSISECFEHGHVHAWSSLLQGVAGLKAFLTHICVSGSDRTRFLA